MRERLVAEGEARALCYWIAVTTGLRRSELASLTTRSIERAGDRVLLVLAAGDEKARRGARIPLRSEVAVALDALIAARAALRRGARLVKLETREPLFRVPNSKTFDRDLAAAGIPKANDAGELVDFHALRHTFGTLLSRSGAPPQMIREAMRHATLDLTFSVYSHIPLDDVTRTVDALPTFDLVETRRALAVGDAMASAAGELVGSGTGDSSAAPESGASCPTMCPLPRDPGGPFESSPVASS